MIGWVASCGAPISNDVLVEDALFVAALPESGRLAPPIGLVTATVGNAAVLADAATGAQQVDALVAVAIAAGEGLRDAAPDERSDEVRVWGAVAVAAVVDGLTYTFFARGEVAEPTDGGDLDWLIEVAPAADGPWSVAGTGRHEANGGDLSWSLDVADVGLSGTLDVHYDLGPPRAVEVLYLDHLGTPTLWTLAGLDALGASGLFAVTADGLVWPGAATATPTRADGSVQTDAGALAFSTCWSAAGDTVYLGGDAGITVVGAEGACRD